MLYGLDSLSFSLSVSCPFDCGGVVFARPEWERILEKNKWNEVDIRDNRYNQVIHLVTAARYGQ